MCVDIPAELAAEVRADLEAGGERAARWHPPVGYQDVLILACSSGLPHVGTIRSYRMPDPKRRGDYILADGCAPDAWARVVDQMDDIEPGARMLILDGEYAGTVQTKARPNPPMVTGPDGVRRGTIRVQVVADVDRVAVLPPVVVPEPAPPPTETPGGLREQHVPGDDGCSSCGACIGCDRCADEQHPIDLTRGDCETCGACGDCIQDCQAKRRTSPAAQVLDSANGGNLTGPASSGAYVKVGAQVIADKMVRRAADAILAVGIFTTRHVPVDENDMEVTSTADPRYSHWEMWTAPDPEKIARAALEAAAMTPDVGHVMAYEHGLCQGQGDRDRLAADVENLEVERDHLAAELSREQGEGDPSWGDLASALHRALDAAALARAERDRARAVAVRLEQDLAEARADMGACDVCRPVVGRVIRIEVHGIEVDDPIEDQVIDAACDAAEARGLDWFASCGPAYEMPNETKRSP